MSAVPLCTLRATPTEPPEDKGCVLSAPSKGVVQTLSCCQKHYFGGLSGSWGVSLKLRSSHVLLA